MHVWALGLSCETPAAPPNRAAGARTSQPENSKRAHFRAPALQTPPKFHEKDQKEEKNEFCGGREKFWASHPSGPPPFRAPHPSGPPLGLAPGLHEKNQTIKHFPDKASQKIGTTFSSLINTEGDLNCTGSELVDADITSEPRFHIGLGAEGAIFAITTGAVVAHVHLWRRVHKSRLTQKSILLWGDGRNRAQGAINVVVTAVVNCYEIVQGQVRTVERVPGVCGPGCCHF